MIKGLPLSIKAVVYQTVLLGCLFVFFFVIFDFPHVLASNLMINNQKAKEGEVVTFNLSVNRAPNTVKAFILEIQYDCKTLSYRAINSGELAVDGYPMFMANNVSPGVVRIGGVGPASPGIQKGVSGNLAYLTFEVAGNEDTNLQFINLKDDIATWTTQDGYFSCIKNAEKSSETGDKDEWPENDSSPEEVTRGKKISPEMFETDSDSTVSGNTSKFTGADEVSPNDENTFLPLPSAAAVTSNAHSSKPPMGNQPTSPPHFSLGISPSEKKGGTLKYADNAEGPSNLKFGGTGSTSPSSIIPTIDGSNLQSEAKKNAFGKGRSTPPRKDTVTHVNIDNSCQQTLLILQTTILMLQAAILIVLILIFIRLNAQTKNTTKA